MERAMVLGTDGYAGAGGGEGGDDGQGTTPPSTVPPAPTSTGKSSVRRPLRCRKGTVKKVHGKRKCVKRPHRHKKKAGK
jgi:hypothetical protein